jgi:hypothetical protein
MKSMQEMGDQEMVIKSGARRLRETVFGKSGHQLRNAARHLTNAGSNYNPSFQGAGY